MTDRMCAHLTLDAPLPPAQVVRIIPRGGTPEGAPAIGIANVPPIPATPGSNDPITFAGTTLPIPDRPPRRSADGPVARAVQSTIRRLPEGGRFPLPALKNRRLSGMSPHDIASEHRERPTPQAHRKPDPCPE